MFFSWILCNLQHTETETELHGKKIFEAFIQEYKYHHIIIKDRKLGYKYGWKVNNFGSDIKTVFIQTVSKNPVLISLSIKNFMSPSSESWEGKIKLFRISKNLCQLHLDSYCGEDAQVSLFDAVKYQFKIVKIIGRQPQSLREIVNGVRL